MAAAAGVSVTTVSHALNDKGRLPESTRDRVKSVAAELGYSPNRTARRLAGGRTGLLGLAVSRFGAPSGITDFAYFTELMLAASTAAIDHGLALALAPSGEALDPQGGLAVDGAVIVDPLLGDDTVEHLRRAGVPVVTTGRTEPSRERGSWIDNDHRAGTTTVLDHLRERGARRIALLASSADISYSLDVETSYREWCRRHSVAPLVRSTGREVGLAAGQAAAVDLLRLAEPPDAIFATYDRLVLGVLMAAEANGLDVPEELLLATVATESQAPERANPPLTTLDLNPRRIGQEAIAVLVDLLDDRSDDQRVIVPYRLMVRRSTSP